MSDWLAALRDRGLLPGQSLRMAVLTVFSFALGFALTTMFVEIIGIAPQAAYAIAIATCSVVNFFACRYWVFRTSRSPMLPEAIKFFASILAFRLAEIGLFHVFFVLSRDYRVAYFATTALSTIGKFLVAKFFIFKSNPMIDP
ncbi:MAG: GtrA family protein [Luteimonas sp.]